MKVAVNSAWQKSCFTAMKHLESGLRIDRRSRKYQSFELIYNGHYDGNDFVEDYHEMLFRQSFTSAAARVNTTHCTLKPSRWKIAVLPQLNTTQTLVAILNFSNCFPYFFPAFHIDHHLDKLMTFSHNKFIRTIKYSRSSKPRPIYLCTGDFLRKPTQRPLNRSSTGTDYEAARNKVEIH